jgi:hypothetical protein
LPQLTDAAAALGAVKMLCGLQQRDHHCCMDHKPTELDMSKPTAKVVNDLSRSLVPLEMNTTLIAVVEMSQSGWLVGGIVPGIERQPLKKLGVDQVALLNLLLRWRAEAEKKDHKIARITVALEAGHDGFWLARWLAAQGIEPNVMHASSVAVPREHRRAKTDRLDTELLKRGFLGWLRGERGHCKMVAVPTLAEEHESSCPDSELPSDRRPDPRQHARRARRTVKMRPGNRRSAGCALSDGRS